MELESCQRHWAPLIPGLLVMAYSPVFLAFYPECWRASLDVWEWRAVKYSAFERWSHLSYVWAFIWALFPKLYRFDRQPYCSDCLQCQQRQAINLTFKFYPWKYLIIWLLQGIDHLKIKLVMSLFTQPHVIPKPCPVVSIEHKILNFWRIFLHLLTALFHSVHCHNNVIPGPLCSSSEIYIIYIYILIIIQYNYIVSLTHFK